MTPVSIDKVVYGGSGLGRLPDGRAVFVPFTAPGDEAVISVDREHPRHAEAHVCEISSPSPDRAEPRCPHFGHCGGCQYQHIKYQAQVRIKRDQLVETLSRLGGLRDLPPVAEIVPAPAPYGYRNKLTLHRFEKDGTTQFGFATSDGDDAFAPTECHLPLPRLWDYAASVLATIAESPDALPEGSERITFRAPSEGDPVHVFDRGDSKSPWLKETVGDWTFELPAPAFWQVNPAILPALVSIVQNWTSDGGRSLVDAFAGAGLFSVTAGLGFDERILVETNRQAMHAARKNHEAHDSGPTRFLPMPTDVGLKKCLQRKRRQLADTSVILDPPRAGCSGGTLATLNRLRPGRIVYVSCDPSTLARDLRKLTASGRYSIRRLAMLDMFPQTAHFETVALLEQ